MIRRRALCLSGGLALLAAHRVGRGQSTSAMRRVGLLAVASHLSHIAWA
jgi:hypothetical protein